MNNEKLYKIIDTVNTAGIKELIINVEDGKVMLYGADNTDGDSTPSVIVVSEADDDVVDTAMGISRVATLLKRMSLFDMEKLKMSCTINSTEEFAKVLTIKESRRKITYTFANPITINVPIGLNEESISNTITLTKEYVAHLVKVNQSLSSKIFNLSGLNNKITVELSDDGDSYTDTISESCNGEIMFNWDARSVLKMFKFATKGNDSLELGIGITGMMYIVIDDITFIIMPQAV